MAYDTTEAVAKFLSGFQMKITNRERDTVAPDYYVKYSLTLSKGGKDFSTTFVSDPRASGEPTVTQVFSALADDALTLRKYSTDEFVDKLYAQGVKPSAALRAYDSCKETNLWMQDELYLSGWEIEEISKILTKYEDEVNTLVEKAASERAARYAYDHPKLPKGFVTITQLQGDLDLGDLRDEVEDLISTVTSPKRSAKLPSIRSMTTTMPFSRGFPTTRSGWKKPSSTAFSKAARAISTRWFRWRSTCASSPTSTTIARISAVTAPSTS